MSLPQYAVFGSHSHPPCYRSNPQAFQQMMQMASLFGGNQFGAGANPFGGAGGGFPAPGTPGGMGAASPTQTAPGAGAPPFNFGLFGNPGAGTDAGQPQLPNPFAMNPALMQQMMAGGGLGNGFGAAPATPADPRPAEERFQVQLQVDASFLRR